MEQTVVHVVRHGQVANPGGVLYGRLPGYHLSELGQAMAQRLGEHFAEVPLTLLRCSPLERARETMAPIAAGHPHLEVELDERVIEAENVFEGKSFGKNNLMLLKPNNLWHLRNPLRPTWGEAYKSVVARMRTAIADAAAAAGRAARRSSSPTSYRSDGPAVGRGPSLVHDPRKRQARLASVTSFSFSDGRVVRVSYAEPAGDLVPVKKSKKFRPGS